MTKKLEPHQIPCQLKGTVTYHDEPDVDTFTANVVNLDHAHTRYRVVFRWRYTCAIRDERKTYRWQRVVTVSDGMIRLLNLSADKVAVVEAIRNDFPTANVKFDEA